MGDKKGRRPGKVEHQMMSVITSIIRSVKIDEWEKYINSLRLEYSEETGNKLGKLSRQQSEALLKRVEQNWKLHESKLAWERALREHLKMKVGYEAGGYTNEKKREIFINPKLKQISVKDGREKYREKQEIYRHEIAHAIGEEAGVPQVFYATVEDKINRLSLHHKWMIKLNIAKETILTK